MLPVTGLLISVYAIVIPTNQAIQSAAVDKEAILNSVEINYDLNINQVGLQSLCPSSTYQFKQLWCVQSRPTLECGYCVTYNKKTKLLSIFNCPYFE